jgi:hypothetical protein
MHSCRRDRNVVENLRNGLPTSEGIFSVSNGTTTASPSCMEMLLVLNQRVDSLATTLPSALTT